MNIIHVCLTGPFTENMAYQDNLLSEQNVLDGNDVTCICRCQKYINNTIKTTAEKKYILKNGVKVYRIKLDKIFNSFLSDKIRKSSKLKELLFELKPDVIFFHGIGGYELLTVAEYKKQNCDVKLYADIHANFSNSASNWISREFLHKGFNKRIIQKSLPCIDKVFGVAFDCMDFAKKMYGIPEEKLELLPLGGIIFEETIREEKRRRKRNELDLSNEDILIVHSGKMDRLKRSKTILDAFQEIKAKNIHLVIIGEFSEDMWPIVEPIIKKDPRIRFLGWRNSEELLEYLCAADLYIQPGGQSATMQNAACCGSALALYPHKSHKMLMGETVFYIDTVESIQRLLEKISANPEVLEKKRRASFELAKKELDYKELAKRIYV